MKNDAAKYLSVRFHPEHEEHARIVGFHRSKKEEKPDDNFVAGAVVADEAAEETSENPSVAPEEVPGSREAKPRDLPSSIGQLPSRDEFCKWQGSSEQETPNC